MPNAGEQPARDDGGPGPLQVAPQILAVSEIPGAQAPGGLSAGLDQMESAPWWWPARSRVGEARGGQSPGSMSWANSGDGGQWQ